MKSPAQLIIPSDLAVLLLLAAARLVLHLLTNGQYGFHRDELATLEDARHLAWGYVAYPPLTPFLGRIELELFGASLAGFRFFSALAQSVTMVVAGRMAKELGGSRWSQAVTAVAVAIAPVALIQGALFQYVAFDYLWVVLIAYFALRLLNSGDTRWWLPIGAAIGLGMMTRYTMGVHAIALALGVLSTRARQHLKSPWLWAGAAIAIVILLPNLVWQVRHDLVSLEFTKAIHERDVAIGRTSGFLPEQLFVNASPVTVPLWIAGLLFYFRRRAYSLLAWMYVIPFAIFLLVQGRSYYLAPAYPALLAAGAVTLEGWLASRAQKAARWGRALSWVALSMGFLISAVLMLPVSPVNSVGWNISSAVHDNFAEQLGWPELTAEVARVYQALPAGEKPRAGILAGNYGEAGAINLYGPGNNLPEVISPANSFWSRGAPDPKIDVLIAVGYSRKTLEKYFLSCEKAGVITNRFGVANEESERGEFFLCRGLRRPWAEVWPAMRRFM